ncbi:MAG: hypothetical protein GF363_00070 [Chitinivibrionales bacterium]|nr:hypothetical protein [Chitinivibrionales bacterium]
MTPTDYSTLQFPPLDAPWSFTSPAYCLHVVRGPAASFSEFFVATRGKTMYTGDDRFHVPEEKKHTKRIPTPAINLNHHEGVPP